jgi:hypothetical protein
VSDTTPYAAHVAGASPNGTGAPGLDPEAGAAAAIAGLREYLHLRDVDHVLFALAVAVSAQLGGDPLWGLLVGSLSSGKTEAIRALNDYADGRLDEITAAGLLSWRPGKNPKPVGLLARLPQDAASFATIADLSTLLASSDRGQRDQLFALLRRVYDGEVVRDLGNAPDALRWRGRLTLLAGVTPAVDNYSSHTDALGPRWLYLRLHETSHAEQRAANALARRNAGQLAEHRRRVARLAAASVHAAARRAHGIDVPEPLAEQLDDAAFVTALAGQPSRATATASARSSPNRPSRPPRGSPASSTHSPARCSRSARAKPKPCGSASARRWTRCRRPGARCSKRSPAHPSRRPPSRSDARSACIGTSPASPLKTSPASERPQPRTSTPTTPTRTWPRAHPDRGGSGPNTRSSSAGWWHEVCDATRGWHEVWTLTPFSPP